MKLFAIYVGGTLPGANIELHDMRFVIAASILDTHEELRKQWWGDPRSLHIDCWAEIDHADGYDVTLRPEPFDGDEKLFYVNLGGYDHNEFTEKHQNTFIVASSVAAAKARSLQSVRHWHTPHRDDMYEAEQVVCLKDAQEHRLHVHLHRNAQAKSLKFTCAYTPIRRVSKEKAGQKTALDQFGGHTMEMIF